MTPSEIPVINSHPGRKTGARRVSDDRYNAVIKFADFRRTGVSLPPLFDVDYLARIKDRLQMLGNDRAGDCEAVRWANNRFLITDTLTPDKSNYPSQEQVWEVYKTQNPGFVPGTGPHGYGSQDDQGMDSVILLGYLHKTGGPDGVKLVCYARVDATNLDEVQAAIDTFGAVWVDIIVLDGNQQEFDQHKPWTDDKSATDGGHAVLGAGIKRQVVPVSDIGEFVDIATWAAETSLSRSFWGGSAMGYSLIMGVYLPVWPEHLGTRQFREGINHETLQQVYGAATGGKTIPGLSPDPAPTPDPTPAPVPTPTPDPGAAPFPGADAAVAARVDRAAARAGLSTGDWLNRRLKSYFKL